MSTHTHRTTLVIGESKTLLFIVPDHPAFVQTLSKPCTYTFTGNIHCPSCVSKIEAILASYEAPTEKHRSFARRSLGSVVDSLSPGHERRSRSTSPDSVLVDVEENKHPRPDFSRINVSLINGTVSFEHSLNTPLAPLIAELEDAGFDILHTDAIVRGGDVHRSASGSSGRSPWAQFSDLFTSISYKTRLEAHEENCEACQAEEAAQNHRGLSASAAFAQQPTGARDAAHDSEVSPPQAVEVNFSIDGMTCA